MSFYKPSSHVGSWSAYAVTPQAQLPCRYIRFPHDPELRKVDRALLS